MFSLTFTRDMANELGANVTNNLVNAVRSGSLGEFAVDPESLSVVQYGTLFCIIIIVIDIFILSCSMSYIL